MSHFYGTLQGSRGEATRGGSKGSGIASYTASWEGAVHTQLWENDGVDMCRVELVPWHGHGTNQVLYIGPVRGPKKEDAPTDERRSLPVEERWGSGPR